MKIFALAVGVLIGFWLIGLIFDRRKTDPGSSRAEQAKRQDAPGPDMRPPPESDPVADACRVLELGRPFTEHELRAAYRKRMSQYHPDKVSGLGPELREVADRKAKEINVAFDLLQRHAH